MTFFLCEIDSDDQLIRRVRAGHDPALIYDRETDSFDELCGWGLPLGVFDDSSYQIQTRGIKPGQIIAIGTDGIRETTNAEGHPFGKARFEAVIHRPTALKAQQKYLPVSSMRLKALRANVNNQMM